MIHCENCKANVTVGVFSDSTDAVIRCPNCGCGVGSMIYEPVGTAGPFEIDDSAPIYSEDPMGNWEYVQ